MKNFNLLPFILLLAIAVILPSCSKDDDDSTTNSFTFDGTTSNIANAFAFPFGSNGTVNGSETFDIDIYLASEGITKGNEGLDGTGDFLYLDLNSGSSTLESGTYRWSNDRRALSIVDAEAGRDYDITNFSGSSVDATSGSVEVEVSGSEVTLTINLESSDGSPITGSYKGSLRE